MACRTTSVCVCGVGEREVEEEGGGGERKRESESGRSRFISVSMHNKTSCHNPTVSRFNLLTVDSTVSGGLGRRGRGLGVLRVRLRARVAVFHAVVESVCVDNDLNV